MKKNVKKAKKASSEKIYKYKFKELINGLPRNIKIGSVVKLLEEQGISKDKFYRDRKILEGAKASIDKDSLEKYAMVFDCTVEDLSPTKVVEGKSIRHLMK